MALFTENVYCFCCGLHACLQLESLHKVQSSRSVPKKGLRAVLKSWVTGAVFTDQKPFLHGKKFIGFETFILRKWRVYWQLARLKQNSWKIKIQSVDQVLDALSELSVFIMNFKSVALFKYKMVIKAKRQTPGARQLYDLNKNPDSATFDIHN